MWWSRGPSRWVLSPPLGLLRSHVSSSPWLFSHRLSLIVGEAGEAETPAGDSLLLRPWPALRFELISAVCRGTVGWGAGHHRVGGLHGTAAPTHPLPERGECGYMPHVHCRPGSRRAHFQLPENGSCGLSQRLVRVAGPTLGTGQASPPCPLSPPSLLPRSCETLCVLRCCLSFVPCCRWV